MASVGAWARGALLGIQKGRFWSSWYEVLRCFIKYTVEKEDAESGAVTTGGKREHMTFEIRHRAVAMLTVMKTDASIQL